MVEPLPPNDPADAQNLDDFLCFALYSTNLAVNRLNKRVLDKLGLTYLQYILLVALYERDDQTVGELGGKLFLDSSTLTPLLKRLETMGHLTRQRDPEDERQVRVRLTPQGRSVREEALAFRSELGKSRVLVASRKPKRPKRKRWKSAAVTWSPATHCWFARCFSM